MKKLIYLDYAAATPIDPGVAKAVTDAEIKYFANPSSVHTPGREAAAALLLARKRIAKSLGAKPTEIIFTSGSTESANLAIKGVAMAHPDSRVAVGATEHEAVMAAAGDIESAGHALDIISVQPSGPVALDALERAITDTTSLVCIQYASNEIGSIQPIAKISTIIAKIRLDRRNRGITLPISLYVDAAQAGLLNLQVAALGVDLMGMGASKFYGPAGIGFLYVRTGVDLEAQTRGGGQELSKRGGTPSVALALGMAEALERAQADRAAEAKRLQNLRDSLWSEIKKIEGIRLNGSLSSRLSANLNFVCEGAPGEGLVSYLDATGFAVATGSACSAASEEPSHVLQAIGLSPGQASTSLRVTLGRQTTQADITSFAEALPGVIMRVRQLHRS